MSYCIFIKKDHLLYNNYDGLLYIFIKIQNSNQLTKSIVFFLLVKFNFVNSMLIWVLVLCVYCQFQNKLNNLSDNGIKGVVSLVSAVLNCFIKSYFICYYNKI